MVQEHYETAQAGGFGVDQAWRARPGDRGMAIQQVGEASIEKVFELDGLVLPLEAMFPGTTDADLAQTADWLDDPHLTDTVASSRINFSWHTFVVRFGDQVVLVDTGHGNDKTRPDFIPGDHVRSDLPAELRAIDVRPEDVTLVLCTHMHYDHIGWNTVLADGPWVPTFPNARHLLPKADYDFLIENHENDPVNGTAFRESVLPLERASMVDLVAPGQEIVRTSRTVMWAEDAAGHSPGSILIHIDSDGRRAVFSGDVIHHPLQLVRADLALSFELERETTIRVRERFLEAVADSGIAVFPAHFGGATGGYVVRDESSGRYRWKYVASS